MESNAARAAVAGLSLVAIVVLFVVLSGGEDEGGSTTTTEVEETTTAVIDQDKPDKPAKPVEAEPQVPVVELVNGEPKGGPTDLEFEKGDEVRFDAESDTEQELHIHGYDIYEDIVPGKTTKVSFPAEIDGIFEIESHSTGVIVAELTVTP